MNRRATTVAIGSLDIITALLLADELGCDVDELLGDELVVEVHGSQCTCEMCWGPPPAVGWEAPPA